MRVLGSVRQSKTKDRAVSRESQTHAITAWSEKNGHGKPVKITVDLSISGKVSAFNRPDLGPYLTDPAKVSQWDILVATKLDRLCRNVSDYLHLRQWCADNGKQVILLSNPELDESTPQGRAMATVQAVFAELERDLAKQRRLETLAELESQGRWPGGRVPYGFRAFETEVGFYLQPDDGGTADIARTMARMAIDGNSNGQIARWLNDNGHLTNVGKPWLVESVRQVLRSPNMAKLLTKDEHTELKHALRSREQTRGARVGGHMLLRVAYCLDDGAPMYGHVRNNRKMRGYYTCHKCGVARRMEDLEQKTEDSLLFLFGDEKIRRKVVISGDDAEIRAAEQDLETLQDVRDQDLVADAVAKAKAKLAELQANRQPDRVTWKPTGQTVAEKWASLETAEDRCKFLRDGKVRVLANRSNVEFHVTEEGMLRITRA